MAGRWLWRSHAGIVGMRGRGCAIAVRDSWHTQHEAGTLPARRREYSGFGFGVKPVVR